MRKGFVLLPTLLPALIVAALLMPPKWAGVNRVTPTETQSVLDTGSATYHPNPEFVLAFTDPGPSFSIRFTDDGRVEIDNPDNIALDTQAEMLFDALDVQYQAAYAAGRSDCCTRLDILGGFATRAYYALQKGNAGDAKDLLEKGLRDAGFLD